MPQTALSEGLRAVEAEIAAGRPARALELCQQLQTRYPRALHVQRVLGEAYLALRKPREALGALDRVLAGNPEDARAYCARAIVQQIQGDANATLAWYRRACDITPDDAVLRAAYGELAASLGQPPYAPSRTGLARLYLRGDLYDHAIREWEAVLAEQPDHLEAQVGLAETLWRTGRMAAAIERCQRTLANAPSCVKPLLILAAIEHDAGREDDAQRIVRRVAELDPDARIGQALFADRLVAGDAALRALLFGEPRFTRSTGIPADTRLPTSSQPLNRPPAPASGPRDGRVSSGPSQSSALPPDFHTIFAETEYMLWNREDDEALARQAALAQQATGALPAAPGAGSGTTVTGDTTARMAAFVPPAMRQAGMTMDETEARAAVNWISWLRAQGARAQDGAAGPAHRPAATGPLPPVGAPRGTREAQSALPTGPLPPPTPEALREMFAELGDDTAARRIVEGQVVHSSVARDARDATSVIGARPAIPAERDVDAAHAIGAAGDGDDFNDDYGDDYGDGGGDGDADGDGDGLDGGAAPARLPDQAGLRDATLRDEAARQALTLEDLEGAYSGSGFRAVELRPGELAALAGQNGPAPAGERGDHGELRLPAEERDTAHTPAAAPDPLERAAPQEPIPEEREPESHAERLERARRRRDDGALPDAVSDYRLILKNSPDLLPEVLDDLDELLAAHPDQPEVHRLAGDARIRQGDYLSAIEAYNRAVALSQERND